ncbi:MAG TPA: response regulator [Candidatus Polarisedimenticolaceae bacterium]|nr:response regulator [Candidatus Polarisedimenticolaceae bacterium]
MWVLDRFAQPEDAAPLAGSHALPTPATHRPRRLLLVEDSVADARLFQHRLRDCDPDATLSVVRDGASAMDTLDQIIEGTAPSPDILVLDLSLPVLKGWSVLRYVKRSPLLRFIPIIVLSNSKTPRDVERAYAEGASSFVHKGRDLDAFFRAVDAIHAYWCGMVDLPQDTGTRH